jgi:outer membrane protein OmpA-like peptidoglycan-associated protein
VGAVAIERGDQTVLVDQAYGAAEVGGDGAVANVESAPAEVVARAIAEYAAAMPVADADVDRVPDESDACPATAGVADTNPLRHGCPRVRETVILVPDEDGHVGSLEIESAAGPVVIDQPFATFELGVDGKARPVTIAQGALVQRNIASVASLLPRADRDGDGIIDAHDACPARPGRIHENEKLHGCPKTLERIVLLPDDDGHVGALEVGESDDAFTLDAAYASAEIAGDGKAVQLRTRAAAVEEDFRETFAARPDYSGARIVIYFNRRAQPTLDVSEQIEDLAADLYGRVGYSVSVVGHTDATGSEPRNRRVGEARAQRVAEDLIAAGVDRAQVTVSSKGSSEPAVRVDDPSIPELKNRRVEIFVTY